MHAKPSKIELQIFEPAQWGPIKDFPVAVGLLFPEGQMVSVPGGHLLIDLGESIPFELR